MFWCRKWNLKKSFKITLTFFCFIDCSEEINSLVVPHTGLHSYQWSAGHADDWTLPPLLAFSSTCWPPPTPISLHPVLPLSSSKLISSPPHTGKLLTVVLLSWNHICLLQLNQWNQPSLASTLLNSLSNCSFLQQVFLLDNNLMLHFEF